MIITFHGGSVRTGSERSIAEAGVRSQGR